MSDVSKELHDFMEALSQQCDCYDQLIQLAIRKNKIIIQNDIQGLQEVTHEETAIVSKNAKLETAREEFASKLSQTLGIQKEDLKLTFLLEQYENTDVYDAIAALKKRLSDTLERLKRENDNNRSLLENALEYIEYSMNVVRSSQGGLYVTGDGQEVPTGKNLFDTTQ